MADASNRNRRRPGRKRFYARGGFWLVLILLGLGACGAAWYFGEAYTRPYRERAAGYDLERINDLEIPSLIVDRKGREIGRIFVQNRSVIPIDDVPQVFIDALRAGEDSRFLEHRGVDYIGTIRALKLTAEGKSQGGSTITQQLARNAYNLKEEALRRNEDTIQRKLVEMFLAMRIEQRYSKRAILGFYLNRIYFGSGFHGIRSASLGYFGKEPRDLDAAECASLVTLIKNPTERSPLNNPKANREGRDFVLRRMNDEGFLSRAELEVQQARPLVLNPKPLRRGTSHLYERIAEAVASALGEDALAAGGFTVRTTILAEAQEAAQKALMESLARAEARPEYRRTKYEDHRNKPGGKPPEYLQGACLMIDHLTGEVIAHVGGRDYAQVPYDFVELGKRPLGTAFFPFIHAAGLESGITPASMVDDEAMDNRSVMVGGREGILGEWGMEVDSPVYEGKITARHALEQSKIGATVRLADQIGLRKVVDTACAFGLPFQKVELLRRLAVGFEEVSLKQAVRAMTAFPLGGRLGPDVLIYVDRVEDAAGRVVYRRARPQWESPQVIDPATAWQVHSMMAGSLYRGSSRGVLEGMDERPFHGAGKGGSTHDFADCWFLGYNSQVTCGVWTGFLTAGAGPIYPGAFSRDLAMPVWQAAMNAVAPAFGGGGLAAPSNVVEVPVCSVSGGKSTRYCQEYREDPDTRVVKSVATSVSEYFRKGTENLPFCGVHTGIGAESDASAQGMGLPALDVLPIRPKAPVLLGDDPYHTEVPSVAAAPQQPSVLRRRANVLDSLDLGGLEEAIPLRQPRRLEIEDE
jgi:membrane peptidoglycan carboxypeptidase